MSHRYTVLSYDQKDFHHTVRDEKGEKRYVDLMVNGDFPQDTDPQSLVGRTFEAEYEVPYIAIAMHVREVVSA